MADVRATSGGGVPTPRPAATPAVRAAQRAFFDAALQKAAPTSATHRSLASPDQTQAAVRPVRVLETEPAETSGRLLRPGSFLDIKV